MENDEGFRFQKLDAYKVAKEIAVRVHEARIADAELRDQATRAAKSAFLGLCEGLPNEQPGLRRRYFTQSRNSVCEMAGAVDLSAAIGAMDRSQAEALLALALRLKRNAPRPHRHKPVSSATRRSAMRAISRAAPSAQSPMRAAISTAAAASTASARAMAKDRALSPRVTRPAPSAMLRQVDFEERRASSRSLASRMCASRTASNSCFATWNAMRR